MGIEVWGLRFRVKGSGLKGYVSGSRVQGSGFGVEGAVEGRGGRRIHGWGLRVE